MQKKYLKKGFGLAEVILAMFVLSVGMITVVRPIISSIPILTETRNFVIADGLAQEGIGLVRNMRDNDFLVTGHDGFDFDGFPKVSTPKQCYLDYQSDSLQEQCVNVAAALALSGLEWDGSLYHSVNTSTDPKFLRKVVIDTPDSGKSFEITSYVVWQPGSLSDIGGVSDCTRGNHCAYAQTVLSGWKFW